eukprot:6212439-Pleurochrysis_carterae.AAC.2
MHAQKSISPALARARVLTAPHLPPNARARLRARAHARAKEPLSAPCAAPRRARSGPRMRVRTLSHAQKSLSPLHAQRPHVRAAALAHAHVLTTPHEPRSAPCATPERHAHVVTHLTSHWWRIDTCALCREIPTPSRGDKPRQTR